MFHSKIYIYIIFLFIITRCVYKRNNFLKLILYVLFSTKGNNGPSSLSKYLKIAIMKWNKNKTLSNYAKLVHKEYLSLDSVKRITSNKKLENVIWFETAQYIQLINKINETILFDRIIYGPIVTPRNWFKSPIKNTYEVNWCYIMKKIKAYILHSYRVKNHIIKFSKCYSYLNKYLILKPCIEINSNKLYITAYNQRKLDILLYIKYADKIKKTEERYLIEYLKARYTIKIIYYGHHSKEELLIAANYSKFVIYFSFYDTGALSLLEMKLMGAWPISHQEEFIETGFGSYVKDLDTNISNFIIILPYILNISCDPYKLSQHVINNLNCVLSLQNIVKRINRKYS